MLRCRGVIAVLAIRPHKWMCRECTMKALLLCSSTYRRCLLPKAAGCADCSLAASGVEKAVAADRALGEGLVEKIFQFTAKPDRASADPSGTWNLNRFSTGY